MMFKKYFAALSIAAAIVAPAAAPVTAPAENLYAMTAIVTGLDSESDTVVVKNSVGLTWEFSGIEDYLIGDVVSMVMDNKGTDIVFDDEILSVRYSGFVAADLE